MSRIHETERLRAQTTRMVQGFKQMDATLFDTLPDPFTFGVVFDDRFYRITWDKAHITERTEQQLQQELFLICSEPPSGKQQS